MKDPCSNLWLGFRFATQAFKTVKIKLSLINRFGLTMESNISMEIEKRRWSICMKNIYSQSDFRIHKTMHGSSDLG
jgi:hypothetical protein